MQTYDQTYYQENRKKILAQRKVYYQQNRSRVKAATAAYAKKNRQLVNDRRKKWRQEHPDKLPFVHTRARYGLTAEMFQAKLIAQNYCCEICGKPFDDDSFRPFVDHNHETDQTRGLLHNHCNRWLAVLEDRPFVERAMKYLERYGQAGQNQGSERVRQDARQNLQDQGNLSANGQESGPVTANIPDPIAVV